MTYMNLPLIVRGTVQIMYKLKNERFNEFKY